MDEPILALAFLSLGLFAGVFFAAVVYMLTIRPRLPEEPPATPQPDPLEQHISAQTAQLTQVQRKLTVYTQQLAGHVQLLTANRPLPANNTTAQMTKDIQAVLSEQAALMEEVRAISQNDRLSARAQRRIVEHRLKQNDALLKRLSTLLDEPLDDDDDDDVGDVSRQYAQIMTQLDELAKIVQQQSTRRAQQKIDTASTTATGTRPKRDRLTDIIGIGPVFSGLLHEADIHTFATLAQQSAEPLRELLDLPDWRSRDVEDWIEQAQEIVDLSGKTE